MFFMHFRLSVQNAFKNGCQYSTGTGQKQRLPFYDISLVIQKKVFPDIMEQVGTRPRSRNTIISCWSCVRCLILTLEIHMLVCVYIANNMISSAIWNK